MKFTLDWLKDHLDTSKDLKNITLGNYLDNSKISKYFINYHIIPMVSAIWSMPPDEIRKMPLRFFIIFSLSIVLFILNTTFSIKQTCYV